MSERQKTVMHHLFTKGVFDFDLRSNGLMSMKNDKTTCDVVFQIGNEDTGIEEILCHSLLFAAQSDVLKALLYGPMHESQNRKNDTSNNDHHVLIEDISPRVFKKCQDYFYGMNNKAWLESILLQRKQFDQDLICKLFYFANKYLIDGMIRLLAYHVSANFVWDIIHAKHVRGYVGAKDDESAVQQAKQDLLQKYFGLLNQLYNMKLINIVQEIIFQIYRTNQSLQCVEESKQNDEKDGKTTTSKTAANYVVECMLLSTRLHILHPEIVQFLLFGIENYKPNNDGQFKISLPAFESESLWTHLVQYCTLYCTSIADNHKLMKNLNMVADNVTDTEFKENVDNDIVTTQTPFLDAYGFYDYDKQLIYQSIMKSYFINYINLDSMSAAFLVENGVLTTASGEFVSTTDGASILSYFRKMAREGVQHTTQLLDTVRFIENSDLKCNFMQNYFNHLKRLGNHLLLQRKGAPKEMIDSEVWHCLIYVLTKINQHWLRPDEKDHRVIFAVIYFCFADLLAKIASKNGITLDQLLSSTKCSVEIELFVKQLIILLDKLWLGSNHRRKYTAKSTLFIKKIFICLNYFLKCFYISNNSQVIQSILKWFTKIECINENRATKSMEGLFVASLLFDGLIGLLSHDIPKFDCKYYAWFEAKEVVLNLIFGQFGGIFHPDNEHRDPHFNKILASVDVLLRTLRLILEQQVFGPFEQDKKMVNHDHSWKLRQVLQSLEMVLNLDACKMENCKNTKQYQFQHKIIAGVLDFNNSCDIKEKDEALALVRHEKSIGESLMRCLDVEAIKLLQLIDDTQFESDGVLIIYIVSRIMSHCAKLICDREDTTLITTLIKASDKMIGPLVELLHQISKLD